MGPVRCFGFLVALVSVFIGGVFYVVVDVSDYSAVSREWLFLFLLLFGFGSSLFTLLAKNNNPFIPRLLDPAIYFPIVFCLYCGLGGITYGSELEVSKDVYYFYFYFVLFFLFGCFLARFKLFVFGNKGILLEGVIVDNKLFSLFLFFLFVVALFSQIFIIGKVGMIFLSPDFQSERTKVIDQVGGYIYYFSLLAIDFIILSLFYKILYKKFPFNKLFFVLSILVSVLMLLSMGSRTRVIYPALVSFVFLYFLYPQKVPLIRFVLLFLVLFLFLVVYGAVRYMGGEGATFVEAFSRIFLGEIKLSSITFDMVLKHVPGSIDFLGAKVIVMPFLTLLPGKNEVLVNVLKEAFGLEYAGGGFTPSLVGSLYIISGFSSVIAGGIIFGFVLSKLYFCSIRGELYLRLIYSFIVVYSLNSLKGGLFKDLEPFWHVAVLFFVVFMSRKRLAKQ